MANTRKPAVVWMPCERAGCGEAFMLRSKDAHDKRFCSIQCAKHVNYPRELYKSPIYGAWTDMKTRCNNPNWKDYHRYGGRGIKVCDQWTSFANFLEDMGPTFAEGLTLDRINNDGNYAPGNCRWADRITQCNNTRRNRIVEFRGEKATLAQWCRRLGLPPKSIQRRYYVQKWDIDRCLSEPIRPYRRTI